MNTRIRSFFAGFAVLSAALATFVSISQPAVGRDDQRPVRVNTGAVAVINGEALKVSLANVGETDMNMRVSVLDERGRIRSQFNYALEAGHSREVKYQVRRDDGGDPARMLRVVVEGDGQCEEDGPECCYIVRGEHLTTLGRPAAIDGFTTGHAPTCDYLAGSPFGSGRT